MGCLDSINATGRGQAGLGEAYGLSWQLWPVVLEGMLVRSPSKRAAHEGTGIAVGAIGSRRGRRSFAVHHFAGWRAGNSSERQSVGTPAAGRANYPGRCVALRTLPTPFLRVLRLMRNGWPFFVGGKLRKIAVEGRGTSGDLRCTAKPQGGSWGDGQIVATLKRYGGLSIVSSSGGTPRSFTGFNGEGWA
jgi:hypothetical protein